MRAELMASAAQFLTQGRVVVDLAVVYERQQPIGAAVGLVCGGRKIEDAEASVPQSDIVRQDLATQLAASVRPAMSQPQHRVADGATRLCPNVTGDAAHETGVEEERRRPIRQVN